MKKHFLFLSVATALTTPIVATAVEVAGEKLEIYGKLHMSIDNSNQDDPAVNNDGMSISSNSSRLGFKGKIPLENGMKLIWQAEQEVRWDDSSKGNFSDRNSYLGLASGAHSLRVGIYDTPFKTVASKWGLFGDSVGERRAVLGAGYDNGNQLNERVKNMVMYQFKNKVLSVQAMYAVEPEDSSSGVDNNDETMSGAGLWWKNGNLKLSASYEDWKQHSKMADGSAYRLAAVYRLNAHQFGAIYEDIDSDTVNEWKRAAYGINWKWKLSGYTDVRAQYITVEDAKNTTDTGARKVALGIFHNLDKKAQVYLAYGATDNDANAKFQAVDGGHGDEVKTVAGGNPSSISAGLIYKF
ncbi:MAG TPA: porin [Gammaproteobacteria bacterium]|nr:porin [Gammaproteobacteria bacterium]